MRKRILALAFFGFMMVGQQAFGMEPKLSDLPREVITEKILSHFALVDDRYDYKNLKELLRLRLVCCSFDAATRYYFKLFDSLLIRYTRFRQAPFRKNLTTFIKENDMNIVLDFQQVLSRDNITSEEFQDCIKLLGDVVVGVVLDGCGQITDDALCCLPECKKLREIEISGGFTGVTAQGLKKLGILGQLKKVNFDEGLRRRGPLLKELSSIEELCLKQCYDLSKDDLKTFQNFSQLKKIILTGIFQFSEDFEEGLSFLPPTVEIVEILGVTAKGVAALPRGIKRLTIDSSVHDEIMVQLGQLTLLKELCLTCCMNGITNEGLKFLQNLHALQTLKLCTANNRLDSGKITAEGLQCFPNKLVRLILKSDTHDAFEGFDQLPASLRVLHIQFPLSDQGFAQLAQLTQVRDLWIHSPKTTITDGNLQPLQGLDTVEELSIWCPEMNFTNDGLCHLPLQLKKLELSGFELTRNGANNLPQGVEEVVGYISFRDRAMRRRREILTKILSYFCCCCCVSTNESYTNITREACQVLEQRGIKIVEEE